MQVNWIVGTKSKIGVDSNAYIIDKLTPNGEVHTLNYILAVVKCAMFQPLYSVLGDDVPSITRYAGEKFVLTLPVVDGKQVISWLALYSRKIERVFMDVKLPETFQMMD